MVLYARSKYVYVRGHEGMIIALTGSDEHDEIVCACFDGVLEPSVV